MPRFVVLSLKTLSFGVILRVDSTTGILNSEIISGFKMPNILEVLAKKFMGKGIDKRFPFLIGFYKQIYSKFSAEGEAEVEIPLSSKLFISKKDSGLGLMLRTKGRFEPVQTKKFIKSVKRGDVVFDIGANVGYYTVLASKLAGRNGKVYAFEPDPRNLALLRRNIEFNKCKNVEVLNFALGSRNGYLELTQDVANPGESSFSSSKKGNKVRVKVTTLDSFIKQRKIKKVGVVKMDVEGSELDVLRGGISFIKESKNLQFFIECNPAALKAFGEEKKNLVAFLKGSWFDIRYIINESKSCLSRYSDKALDGGLDKAGFVNLYAVKVKKTTPKPFVTVLMTAYNAEKYIAEAIGSILSQTYKNFELIIVNDSSIDDTLAVIDKFAKRDKRIKVLNLKRNLGPSLAANKGLRKVKGDYLFRMDADDISEGTRLEKQIDFLQNNPDVSMLGGQCKLIDKEGSLIGEKRFPTDDNSIFGSLFIRNPIQHPASVINLKNLTSYAMLHDGSSVLAHDLELVFLASQKGRLANLGVDILKYRQYYGSFSLKNPKKTFFATLAVRIGSVLKYRYVPSVKGVLTTLAQIVFVVLSPSPWIYPIYSYLRGMRKIDLKRAKISFDANFIFKKAFELVKV